jgi:hypothetical protein
MADDKLDICDPDEPDPMQSQRKILTGLLARFTADRDLLITTVRACEERLQELASRLDVNPPGEAAARLECAAVDELSQAVAERQRAQDQALTEARVLAEQSLARSDHALQRVEEIVSSRNGANAEDALAHITADHEAVAATLRECVQRIEALSARVDATRAAGEQAAARAEAALRRCEELAAMRSHDIRAKQLQAVNRAVERLEAEIGQLRSTAAKPQEALSRLVEHVASIEGELEEIRRKAGHAPDSQASAVQTAGEVTTERRPPDATPPAKSRLRTAIVGAGLLVAVVAVVTVVRQEQPQRSDSPVSSPKRLHAVAPKAESHPAAARGSDVGARTDAAARPAAAAPSNPSQSKPPEKPAAPDTRPQLPPAPAGLLSLGPEDATTCIVQPQQQRVCLYQQSGSVIAADACLPIRAQVNPWPGWLVVSQQSAQSIRLVDENGRERLAIVPEGKLVGANNLQLAQADFDVLSSKVKPWRTTWLASDQVVSKLSAAEAAELKAAFEGWQEAWEQKRFDDYVRFYGASFVPQSGHSASSWQARKRYLFKHSGTISLGISGPTIVIDHSGQAAVVSFEQAYRSAISTSHAFKAIQWQRDGNDWKIRAETVLQELKD